MNRLEYSTARRPQRLWWEVLRPLVVVVGAVVLLPAGCVGVYIGQDWRFFSRMHNASVIGKTQAQIIAQLGRPDPRYTMTASDGTTTICYQAWSGDGFRIDLRNGIANNTVDLEK